MSDETEAKPAKAKAAAPVVEPGPDPAAQQQMRDDRYRNSRGGQVVLDPESDASLGARGGAGGTIEENQAVRDEHLLAHSLDPRDPDASHLEGNVVPAGGAVMDQVSDDHEPVFTPDVDADKK